MSNNGSLRRQIASGLFWKFGERIIAQGISFIVSVILARILMPEDYGVIALIQVFITLANVFVSNGLGDALIQKKDTDELDFSTMFYCSVGMSLVLYFILFFSSPIIANFYGDSNLVPYIRVLSLQILLSAIKTIQHSYVSKHMMFRKFFFSTLGGTIISGFVGVLMALRGFGAWALIAQYLVNSILDMTVLFITVSWRPRLQFSLERAKELTSYGWKLMLSQFINVFYGELRGLIIGKKYSAADLAYYNKGNQFPSLALSNLNTSISTVLFPAMSKVNGDMQRLKHLTRQSMKISSYVVFPIMAGLMAIATPLVRWMLTEKWLYCVPFMQMCCVYWAFQPLQTANVQAIKAAGRADLCLKLEIIKKIIGFSLLFLTMGISVEAMVFSNVIFAAISTLINIYPNKKLIGYGYKEQCIDVLPAALLSSVVFLSAWGVQYIGFNDLITLGIQCVVGIFVYVIGSWIFKLDSFLFICGFVKSYIKK